MRQRRRHEYILFGRADWAKSGCSVNTVWLYVRLDLAGAVSKFNTPLVLFISNGPHHYWGQIVFCRSHSNQSESGVICTELLTRREGGKYSTHRTACKHLRARRIQYPVNTAPVISVTHLRCTREPHKHTGIWNVSPFRERFCVGEKNMERFFFFNATL